MQSADISVATNANGNEGDPDAEFYQVADPDQLNGGYTAANNFWNADRSDPNQQFMAVADGVPRCDGTPYPYPYAD